MANNNTNAFNSTETDGRLIFQNSYETEWQEENEVRGGDADSLSRPGGADVTLQHEGLIDDVDDPVRALHVRPEHMDPVAVPLDVVICENNKLV